MESALKITFSYRFSNGVTKAFDLLLDRRTLSLSTEHPADPLPWTLLKHSQCANCPLDGNRHSFCPVAVNFAAIADYFAGRVSHETVRVTVTSEERIYAKDAAIQQGLTPLLGIIMTTSGCPVMEPLKPMVRFHLPFATLTETIFRSVSMYLVAQYLRSREAKPFEFGLEGLAKIYREVAIVNRDFAQRLRAAAKEDATVNALVGLDCFTIAPLAAEDMLREIRPYFSAYLD